MFGHRVSDKQIIFGLHLLLIQLRMDIIEIKSIQDYMKALSVFQKTQEIRMIVDRNGERIELNVKFLHGVSCPI